MKHFFIRLAFFSLPIALLVSLILTSAFYLADALPIPVMIRWQQQSDTPLVFQPWSARNLVNYKFEALQVTQPQVMIMGSSRMTLFRATLANRDPSRFYNAGIPSSNVFDWQPFLEQVIASGHTPDVIILGLDLSNYNQYLRQNARQLSVCVKQPEFTVLDRF